MATVALDGREVSGIRDTTGRRGLGGALTRVCDGAMGAGQVVVGIGPVPPEDVESLAAALLRLLKDDGLAAEAAERSRATGRRFTWSQSLAPLVEFVRTPQRAPDVSRAKGVLGLRDPEALVVRRGTDETDRELFTRYLREGGVGEVMRRATGRVRRVVRRR